VSIRALVATSKGAARQALRCLLTTGSVVPFLACFSARNLDSSCATRCLASLFMMLMVYGVAPLSLASLSALAMNAFMAMSLGCSALGCLALEVKLLVSEVVLIDCSSTGMISVCAIILLAGVLGTIASCGGFAGSEFVSCDV
jgi:hypothetical protein